MKLDLGYVKVIFDCIDVQKTPVWVNKLPDSPFWKMSYTRGINLIGLEFIEFFGLRSQVEV